MIIKYNNYLVLLRNAIFSKSESEEMFFIYNIQSIETFSIQQYFENFFYISNFFIDNKKTRIFIDCYRSGHFDVQVGDLSLGTPSTSIDYNYLYDFFSLIIKNANKIQ